MHFLESFALNCGAKIDKPFLLEKYHPLDVDKFISFYPFDSSQSRTYDHWTEFIRIILPALQEQGISIVQMGRGQDPIIETCIPILGKLTVNQSSYIIRNSLLHLCVNSFSAHLSSALRKKTIALFSESPPETNGPYETDENFLALLPKLKGNKYTYTSEENPKTINSIYPEEIAKSVCSLLGIDLVFPYKTLYIGEKYNNAQIESIPSKPIDISNLTVDSLIVRMDKKFDEAALYNQLMSCNCSIITDEPININLIKNFRSRIPQFVYMLTEKHDKKYVEELFDEGIQCLLMTEIEDEKQINDLKLEYLDYGRIHKEKGGKREDLECLKDKDMNKLFYRSAKYLINDGDIYLNSASMKEGLSVESLGNHLPQKVIDSELFWKEHDHYILFERL